jgi:hypothetical protein
LPLVAYYAFRKRLQQGRQRVKQKCFGGERLLEGIRRREVEGRLRAGEEEEAERLASSSAGGLPSPTVVGELRHGLVRRWASSAGAADEH